MPAPLEPAWDLPTMPSAPVGPTSSMLALLPFPVGTRLTVSVRLALKACLLCLLQHKLQRGPAVPVTAASAPHHTVSQTTAHAAQLAQAQQAQQQKVGCSLCSSLALSRRSPSPRAANATASAAPSSTGTSSPSCHDAPTATTATTARTTHAPWASSHGRLRQRKRECAPYACESATWDPAQC